MKLPNSELLAEYWRKEIIDMLTKDLEFIRLFPPLPDTRPWWRKIYDRLHYSTVGRFRDWLHRDCGDY